MNHAVLPMQTAHHCYREDLAEVANHAGKVHSWNIHLQVV